MTSENDSNIRCRSACVTAFLLVILAEILVSLVLDGGVFSFRPEMLLVDTVRCVCRLAPVVLLSFACLSILLAAYGRDEAVACLSVALQAASWLLILIGLVGYLSLNLGHLSCGQVAPWVYVYAAIEVELPVTIYLTRETRRKILPDWEMHAALNP